MANIWFWSDPHLGHANILNFKLKDGTPMRPFANVDEMNDALLAAIRALVRPSDKVYCLGDVCMNKKFLSMLDDLPGHWRLVRGNHDDAPTKQYMRRLDPDKVIRGRFEEIYATRLIDRTLLLSHIPVHPESLRPEWTNVHGHVHNNVKPLHFGPKYLNISVEVTDYKPLALEDVHQRIRKQQHDYAELMAIEPLQK